MYCYNIGKIMRKMATIKRNLKECANMFGNVDFEFNTTDEKCVDDMFDELRNRIETKAFTDNEISEEFEIFKVKTKTALELLSGNTKNLKKVKENDTFVIYKLKRGKAKKHLTFVYNKRTGAVHDFYVLDSDESLISNEYVIIYGHFFLKWISDDGRTGVKRK